jgi:rare lipoprotein A
MLMATLREGGPAPAPSKVMVAAAKPFIPEATRANEAPLPPERPSFALASASSRPAKAASGGVPASPAAASSAVASSTNVKAKTSAQPAYASAAEPDPPPPQAVAAPATSFAPPRAEASFFGFISGRGLY